MCLHSFMPCHQLALPLGGSPVRSRRWSVHLDHCPPKCSQTCPFALQDYLKNFADGFEDYVIKQ